MLRGSSSPCSGLSDTLGRDPVTIPEESFTAVVGESGAGKMTFVGLIGGVRENVAPTWSGQGGILIDRCLDSANGAASLPHRLL